VSAASHAADLAGLAHESVRVLRRGTGTAILVMLFMLVLAIAFGFLLSLLFIIAVRMEPLFTRRTIGAYEPSIIWTALAVAAGAIGYSVMPALLQAGPLAVYGSVALGENPDAVKAARVALRAVLRLSLLHLLIVVGPVFGYVLLSAGLALDQRGAVAEGVAIATFGTLAVWAQVRVLLFAQVSVALPAAEPGRERPSSWQLGRGRFPLQLVATLAPYAAIAAARPSAVASDLLSGGITRTISLIVAIGGGVVFAFVRPALAAAAYVVALGTAPERAAT
jgi:hypothetical protein